jgi:hypothetical protein
LQAVFAVVRSVKSLEQKQLSPWKLMLRDGLNLYAVRIPYPRPTPPLAGPVDPVAFAQSRLIVRPQAIFLVNLVNMLFWFIAQPTGIDDAIKTTVTSMTAVLTTTMSLRIVLSIRGSLTSGGHFAGVWSTSTGSRSATVPPHGASILQISSGAAPTYTLEGIGHKQTAGWDAPTTKVLESKEVASIAEEDERRSPNHSPGVVVAAPGLHGVHVTVQREVVKDGQ